MLRELLGRRKHQVLEMGLGNVCKKKKKRSPVLEMHSEIFIDSIMLFLDFASKIFHYRVRADGAIKEIRIILS